MLTNIVSFLYNDEYVNPKRENKVDFKDTEITFSPVRFEVL